MNLYHSSFWTFVSLTGRVPRVAPENRLGAPGPIALKALSRVFYTAGDDAPISSDEVLAKAQANALRPVPAAKLQPPLMPQRLKSDAMGLAIPGSLILPVQGQITLYGEQ